MEQKHFITSANKRQIQKYTSPSSSSAPTFAPRDFSQSKKKTRKKDVEKSLTRRGLAYLKIVRPALPTFSFTENFSLWSIASSTCIHIQIPLLNFKTRLFFRIWENEKFSYFVTFNVSITIYKCCEIHSCSKIRLLQIKEYIKNEVAASSRKRWIYNKAQTLLEYCSLCVVL